MGCMSVLVSVRLHTYLRSLLGECGLNPGHSLRTDPSLWTVGEKACSCTCTHLYVGYDYYECEDMKLT
ncbi:hypothetical protein PI125_g21118 [Phytophthora idaei]|nr:hypothetical protein PI125_g21118 [Phytophthora idaei]KAG3134259.1 hypothetical protein PI126_g18772 [Phytophthora idaei]